MEATPQVSDEKSFATIGWTGNWKSSIKSTLMKNFLPRKKMKQTTAEAELVFWLIFPHKIEANCFKFAKKRCKVIRLLQILIFLLLKVQYRNKITSRTRGEKFRGQNVFFLGACLKNDWQLTKEKAPNWKKPRCRPVFCSNRLQPFGCKFFAKVAKSSIRPQAQELILKETVQLSQAKQI